ncbi:MAG: single-stranded-DNA-specific exonuclease RecJ [Candidatus Makaraimicrobium thalassicum]|nr:MAG: single-stranded-DNA-specific exonuclease RecJ [Candidatus Omnitrophota bacterium]
MKKKWKVYEANPRLQQVLSSNLGISPVFAQLLLNRGIRTPEQAQKFLFGRLSSCNDPFLMKDMDRGVERIKKAVENNERIMIYGDYDVDGVTSTALLASIFEELGARYETFIPNRIEEGYGLNVRAVARAREDGVKLIITVDCGINSVEEVECANNYGMDVIVTDHHEVKTARRPEAYAIIDPHQPDCPYPFNYLAGVGVVYKLARALMKGREAVADRHLDLVALGTIADVVPINGENRVLAKNGLKKLRQTDKPGLKALMDVARVNPKKLTCKDIGFALGPRINAMGRVGSASVALELLMCGDDARAREIALTLDRENKNRQNIERNILKQVLGRVEKEVDLENEKVIVLADESWHPGVIGIVASRLTEQYRKPAILIALKDGRGRGSGRGVDGFNLFEAINKASSHLIDFGGHEQACGLKIRKEDIGRFRESLNEVAGDYFVKEETALPELKIDLCLPFSHIETRLINELGILMPHGPGNSEPVFSSRGLKVKNTPRNIGRNGFKFLASCGNLTCEAVTFKKNDVRRPAPGDVIDLAYTPSINSWDGLDSIQLNIRDLQIAMD